MGMWNAAKGCKKKENFTLTAPAGSFQAGQSVLVALFDDHLTISSPLVKTSLQLSYSQIQQVSYDTDLQIHEKDKSVLGRAAVGAILGPAGAVVGAISGIGTKKTKRKQHLLCIRYQSAAGGAGVLTLEDRSFPQGKALADSLMRLCGQGQGPGGIQIL